MSPEGKRIKRLRIIEFVFIGIFMGMIEDLIAVFAVTGEAIKWRTIWIVFMVALPFAFLSEIVVDHPRFWEYILPRKKDKCQKER